MMTISTMMNRVKKKPVIYRYRLSVSVTVSGLRNFRNYSVTDYLQKWGGA